jgi:tripartite-type tricarboxylate transporter receptor subunit TctC
MKFTRRSVLAAAAASLAVPAKASPGWPAKGAIRLIATFPPGGTADTISRILAPKLSAALGVQVVVENKPGAGGRIGSDLAAVRATPDKVASGIGSNTHLMGEQLAALAGVKLKHVPHKGSAPMTPAEYAKFVGDFAAIWTNVSKDAGIPLELG